MARFKADISPAPGVAARRLTLELAIVGTAYFGWAKRLTLAALYSSGIPLWAPAGVALAAVLLRGMRVWPAIFAAAFAAGPPIDVADATTADSILLSAAVATGNTLEALVGGGLIKVWSHGRSAFETAAGTAKFALVAAGPSAALGAAVGIGSLLRRVRRRGEPRRACGQVVAARRGRHASDHAARCALGVHRPASV